MYGEFSVNHFGNSAAEAILAKQAMNLVSAYSIVLIVIGILTIIAYWKIFTKAGEEGWKSLIPIYNTVVLFKIAGISPWWILAYFAAVIPLVGWAVVLGVMIYSMISLAKAFGKSGAFAAGLIIFNTLFILILGFGNAEYQGNKVNTAE